MNQISIAFLRFGVLAEQHGDFNVTVLHLKLSHVIVT